MASSGSQQSADLSSMLAGSAGAALSNLAIFCAHQVTTAVLTGPASAVCFFQRKDSTFSLGARRFIRINIERDARVSGSVLRPPPATGAKASNALAQFAAASQR